MYQINGYSRNKLIQKAIEKFNLIDVDPFTLLPAIDLNKNTFICNSYSPVWMVPYSIPKFCRYFLYEEYCFCFYTDVESKISASDKDFLYFWVFKIRENTEKKLTPFLLFLSSIYQEDKLRPEVITILPENEIDFDAGLSINPLSSEFIYYTKDLISLKLPKLRGARQAAVRYSRDMAQYQTYTLAEFCHNNLNRAKRELEEFIFYWYETKDIIKIKTFTSFEVMPALISKIGYLLSLSNIQLNGIVVKDIKKNKIIGFTVAHKLNDNSWCFLIRFPDPLYPSITFYLLSETAKIYKDKQFCYDGGDGGDKGLFDFKSLFLRKENRKQGSFDRYYTVLPKGYSHIGRLCLF